MTTGSDIIRDLRNQSVGGGLGFFNLPRPDPTLPRVPTTQDKPNDNGNGLKIDTRTDEEKNAAFIAETANRLLSEFPSKFGNLDEAILYLTLDNATRKALWPGFNPSSGSGGSTQPLWRPGELELLLRDFGLDVDKFKEDNRQFALEFGLQKDEFGLRDRQLGETIRANKALEADRARGRGLQAASDALSAYLRASEARDARQVGVLQSLPSLLPSIIDPDQTHFAGLEPGGLLARAAAKFGLGDIGSVPVTPVTLNIGDFIAGDPEQAAIRQDLIDKILETGGVAQQSAQAEAAATGRDVSNAQGLPGARAVPGGTVFKGGSEAQKAFNKAIRNI